MSKLYVGNLPADATEANLLRLFQEHGLNCTSVLVKRGGYAFVDCADQSVADRSIDKLNGFNFMGMPLLVEPSVSPAAGARKGAMNQMNDHSMNNGGAAASRLSAAPAAAAAATAATDRRPTD